MEYNEEDEEDCLPPHLPDCDKQGGGALSSSILIPWLMILPQTTQRGGQREDVKVSADISAHDVEHQVRLLIIV